MPKPILPADLTSLEWEAMEKSLTARGFLSARVEDARTLGKLQELCESISSGSLSEGEARDRARIWLDQAGYAPDDPEDEGTIKDLRAKSRLDVLFDTNVTQTQALAWHNAGQRESILDVWPCQELFRAIDSNKKRDWNARWRAAGGRLYGGRMIARKDDPIWTRISRFGAPYPPFDFNSGMDIRDVSRSDAEDLGVIEPEEEAPTPRPIDPLAGYQVDATGFSPDLARDIVDLSEGLVDLVGGVLRWARSPSKGSFRRHKHVSFKQCPNDGGFMTTEGGCNHPNHIGHTYAKEWQEAKPSRGATLGNLRCTPHEGIEFLKANPKTETADKKTAIWKSSLIEKYQNGTGRKDGLPDPKRFGLAKAAVITTRYPMRTIANYRGNQSFYYREFEDGNAVAVFVDNETREVNGFMRGTIGSVRHSIGHRYFKRGK